jgi:hypothetical protein
MAVTQTENAKVLRWKSKEDEPNGFGDRYNCKPGGKEIIESVCT